MRFVAPRNDNQAAPETQQSYECDHRDASGPQHISLFAASVLQKVGEAMIASAREVVRAETRMASRTADNDNLRRKIRRDTSRMGRVWASAVRRTQRECDCGQREAITVLAEQVGRSATEIETLVKLHHRKREARIVTMRQSAIIRYRMDGLSNKQIAERLNVTPQHVGRLLREFKVG